jgi:hypothetical protein
MQHPRIIYLQFNDAVGLQRQMKGLVNENDQEGGCRCFISDTFPTLSGRG